MNFKGGWGVPLLILACTVHGMAQGMGTNAMRTRHRPPSSLTPPSPSGSRSVRERARETSRVRGAARKDGVSVSLPWASAHGGISNRGLAAPGVAVQRPAAGNGDTVVPVAVGDQDVPLRMNMLWRSSTLPGFAICGTAPKGSSTRETDGAAEYVIVASSVDTGGNYGLPSGIQYAGVAPSVGAPEWQRVNDGSLTASTALFVGGGGARLAVGLQGTNTLAVYDPEDGTSIASANVTTLFREAVVAGVPAGPQSGRLAVIPCAVAVRDGGDTAYISTIISGFSVKPLQSSLLAVSLDGFAGGGAGTIKGVWATGVNASEVPVFDGCSSALPVAAEEGTTDADGLVFAVSGGRIRAFSSGGDVVWEFDAAPVAPSVAGGRVFFAGSRDPSDKQAVMMATFQGRVVGEPKVIGEVSAGVSVSAPIAVAADGSVIVVTDSMCAERRAENGDGTYSSVWSWCMQLDRRGLVGTSNSFTAIAVDNPGDGSTGGTVVISGSNTLAAVVLDFADGYVVTTVVDKHSVVSPPAIAPDGAIILGTSAAGLFSTTLSGGGQLRPMSDLDPFAGLDGSLTVFMTPPPLSDWSSAFISVVVTDDESSLVDSHTFDPLMEGSFLWSSKTVLSKVTGTATITVRRVPRPEDKSRFTASDALTATVPGYAPFPSNIPYPSAPPFSGGGDDDDDFNTNLVIIGVLSGTGFLLIIALIVVRQRIVRRRHVQITYPGLIAPTNYGGPGGQPVMYPPHAAQQGSYQAVYANPQAAYGSPGAGEAPQPAPAL